MNDSESTNTTPRAKGKHHFAFVAIVLAAVVCLALALEIWRRFDLLPARTNTEEPPVDGARAAPFPRTLVDANGDRLTIAARPMRIASQTLGTDEILLAITQPERIVAFSKLATDPKYSNVAEQVLKMGAPAVQNAEDILQLDPDLIFVASYSRAETVAQLQAAGAPAYRFANFDRIEDIRMNIRAVGRATGDDERAADLVRQMDEELAHIRARHPPEGKRPRVMSYGASGYTAGARTLFDDIIRHAGGTNISAENGIEGFRKISAEQVLAWQPDYIVVSGSGEGESMEDARRALLLNPAVAATNAARERRIIVMDTRYSLTVSHHVVRAVEMLANDLFADAPGGTQ